MRDEEKRQILSDMSKCAAVSDQAWASMDPYLDDLKRIVSSGPQDARDGMIIEKALNLVMGDLHTRRFKRDCMEEGIIDP